MTMLFQPRQPPFLSIQASCRTACEQEMSQTLFVISDFMQKFCTHWWDINKSRKGLFFCAHPVEQLRIGNRPHAARQISGTASFTACFPPSLWA